MSTTPDDDGRTATDQLDHHAIAARLECDGEELRLFVESHPNPTASAVLGFAEADPEHRKAVTRWLDSREGPDAPAGDWSAITEDHRRRGGEQYPGADERGSQ